MMLTRIPFQSKKVHCSAGKLLLEQVEVQYIERGGGVSGT